MLPHWWVPKYLAERLDSTIDELIGAPRHKKVVVDNDRKGRYHAASVPPVVSVKFPEFMDGNQAVISRAKSFDLDHIAVEFPRAVVAARGRPQTHQQTRTLAHPHTRTTSRLPARTHGHTDIRIHAHTHTRTDAHTHTRTHAHTHTRTREHANTHLTPRAQCASSLCCDVPMQVPERVVRMLPRPQRMQSTVWIELTTDTLEWLPKLTRISLLCFRISSPPPL